MKPFALSLSLALAAGNASAQSVIVAPRGAWVCDKLAEVRELVRQKRVPSGCGRLRGAAMVYVVGRHVVQSGRWQVIVLRVRDANGFVQFSPFRRIRSQGVGT